MDLLLKWMQLSNTGLIMTKITGCRIILSRQQVRYMVHQWDMVHILEDSRYMYTVFSGFLFQSTLQTMA